MRRSIKVSEDTYNLLNNEKGDETSLDGAIRRLVMAKEMLPPSTQEGLETLSTHTERGVFLAGMLYNAVSNKDHDWGRRNLKLVENLDAKNFRKLYTMITAEMYREQPSEKMERLSEMASFELFQGDIESMPTDDMRYLFTLGQTLPRK